MLVLQPTNASGIDMLKIVQRSLIEPPPFYSNCGVEVSPQSIRKLMIHRKLL